jgi:hypothetical protein
MILHQVILHDMALLGHVGTIRESSDLLYDKLWRGHRYCRLEKRYFETVTKNKLVLVFKALDL